MHVSFNLHTGLPKAAVITHERALIACTLVIACRIKSEDIIYTALPLYHSAALLIGVNGCIMQGRIFYWTNNAPVFGNKFEYCT